MMGSGGNGVTRKKLGELLCERAYLDEGNLGLALAEQKVKPRRLGQILLDLGYVTQAQLNEALSIQAGIEQMDLADVSSGWFRPIWSANTTTCRCGGSMAGWRWP